MPHATSVGKPLLVFSSNDRDARWRLIEKVAAITESYLQDVVDPFTFSSARIRNSIDELEEVDVLFSMGPDPTDAFAFVEVRDRKAKDGRPRIEEIMGRKKNLGIDRATVYSTRGFTGPAVALAVKEGIRLRVIEASAGRPDWLNVSSLGVRVPVASVEKLAAVLVGTNGEITTAEAPSGNVRVFELVGDVNRQTTANRIFHRDVMTNNQVERNKVLALAPQDGTVVRTHFSVSYAQPRYRVDHDGTLLPVRAFVFFLEVSMRTVAEADFRETYLSRNAHTGEVLAELALGYFPPPSTRYACLIRHCSNEEGWQVGGALFG